MILRQHIITEGCEDHSMRCTVEVRLRRETLIREDLRAEVDEIISEWRLRISFKILHPMCLRMSRQCSCMQSYFAGIYMYMYVLNQ